jgi:hypothetical protein
MIVLYRSTLLSSDVGDFLPKTQTKFFKLMCWVRHRPPVSIVSWWVPSSVWILFSNQLGPLARVSLAFFFAVVPVVAAIWDYYGFLVCRDGLYFFGMISLMNGNFRSSCMVWLVIYVSITSTTVNGWYTKEICRSIASTVSSYKIFIWRCFQYFKRFSTIEDIRLPIKNSVFWDVTPYFSYKNHAPYHPRRLHSS